MNTPLSTCRGFSLVELAIVLLVLGILARSALRPLSEIIEHRNDRTAAAQIEVVRQQVIAHVVAQGVLPCPLPLSLGLLNQGEASNRISGSESRPFDVIHQQTVNSFELAQRLKPECHEAQGLVPARTLSLLGTVNTTGALLDPWSRPYQLAVSFTDHADRGNPNVPDWTHVGEAAQVGLPQLQADIVICNRVVRETCPARDVRASQIAFVVWSLGKDGTQLGVQEENQDGDNVFVLQERSEVAEHAFDDHLTWGTAADVMYWMLRAGWLP